MIYFRALSLVTILSILLFSAFCVNAGDSKNLNSTELKQKSIAVEELGAEFHTASGTITVTAKIKNISRSIIRGYATIYLLSAEGQELYTYQEDVNGGEAFPHGATIDFQASTHVSDISKVSSISVDFTQF